VRAASHLLSREHLRIYLILGQARVAAPGLERALEEAQEKGLIVFKLTERPKIEATGKPRLSVSFVEPILHLPVHLNVSYVVCEELYRAAPHNARLAEILKIPLSPGGFLQEDNVHHLPVTTLRRGVLVAGPGRGVMELAQAEWDAEAVVEEVEKLLGRGTAIIPQGRAVVDRGRCTLCLTCYRVCPHQAITYDNRAIIQEIACQGCGLCASECPQEAIQIRNYTDEQVEGLFASFDPQLSPRIVAFLCQNSAWEAYQAALKLKHAILPPGFTAIRMPCAGKIDADYLLRAVVYGARGVLVLACHPDNCKSHQGNEFARWRVASDRAFPLYLPIALYFLSDYVNGDRTCKVASFTAPRPRPGDFIPARKEVLMRAQCLVEEVEGRELDSYDLITVLGLLKEHDWKSVWRRYSPGGAMDGKLNFLLNLESYYVEMTVESLASLATGFPLKTKTR